MQLTFRQVFASAAAVAGVACSTSDSVTDPALTSVADAFAPALTGYDRAQSSFADGTDVGLSGGSLGGRGRHGQGLGLMGGGLGGGFIGRGFGPRFGHRPFDELLASCSFDEASGRVSCGPVTVDGLTISRSVAYLDADRDAQSAFDSVTTNTINVQTEINGEVVDQFGRGRGRHGRGRGPGPDAHLAGGGHGAVDDGTALDTTTVAHESERTVTGLADGSAERTVNGTSAGTETTIGTDMLGDFMFTRVAGDTITDVVIPVLAIGPSYPTAGTVVRSMQLTLTYDGQTPQTSSRREVITYDGSTTATVVITQNGETTTCRLPLPRGRLSCQ